MNLSRNAVTDPTDGTAATSGSLSMVHTVEVTFVPLGDAPPGNISSREDYVKLLNKIETDENATPLFLKTSKGDLQVISTVKNEAEIDSGSKLVYLGKPLEP